MAKPRISFEYFPPKTGAGIDKLLKETTPALNALNPEFFSVTYGAGGTTRDTTLGVVSAMGESGIDVAPHLSFGGDDEETVGALLETYKARGLRRLVALRLGVYLRVGRHLNLKVITGALTDETDEVVGMHQLHAGSHARGHVTAQGNQALDTA